MAVLFNITADHHLFVGDDRSITIPVYADHDLTTALDVNGHDLIWQLKYTDTAEGVLIEKSTGGGGITIAGTFNEDPALNAQRVVITLEAEDSYPGGSPGGTRLKFRKYRYSLKRTNEGARSTFQYGYCQWLVAATAAE